MSAMDVAHVFKEFQDYLAPRLDTYEQAIYLYLFRHTRLVGLEEAVIGFKSARTRMACGIGEKGRPMFENTAYEKLQSLQQKGCIVILDSTRDGRKIRVNLPSEIHGVVGSANATTPPDIEVEDFFGVEENRRRILLREGNRVFLLPAALCHQHRQRLTVTITSSSTFARVQSVTAIIVTSSPDVGSATIEKVPRLLRIGYGRCIAKAP
jgi:hypothetical protein